MRVESDRQGHHRSGAPACHRCGVPLLEGATFCPYCEQWLDAAPATGTVTRQSRRIVTQRGLLTAGSVLFLLLAVASFAAAFVL